MSGKIPKRNGRPGVDRYGRAPLHYAARDGNADLCSQLLSAGADPNAQDDNGWGPLHFAAQANSEAVTRILINAGANVALKDSFGNTPLFRAVFASRGDGSVIQALRESGADPNALNKSGTSPLELARKIGNYDVAKFFADLS
jgi:uncharacterized protein